MLVMDPWMLRKTWYFFVDRCSVEMNGAAPASHNNGGGISSEATQGKVSAVADKRLPNH